MTIGIDIRVLARGSRTGVEEYVLNLLPHLFLSDPNVKYKLFYNSYQKINLNYPWLRFSNTKLYEFKIPNRLLSYLNWPKADQLIGGADVFFSPHFLMAGLSRNVERALTFHDLSFEYFPEFFPWRQRLWHHLVSPCLQARRAHKIIAVSDSTKEDLIDLYKIPEDKIRVIYSGIDPSLRHFFDFDREKIREKYNLPAHSANGQEKLILYLGTLEPRKNLVGLIKAFEILKKDYRGEKIKEAKLVIAGGKGWLYEDIFRAARISDFTNDIFFTGFVAPEDKVYFYNLADLFVYPSFFEGFGFPPLEAMVCGRPVITSNLSSLPEVVGDAALMIDPYNPAELAWAMKEVLEDDGLRDDLRERGLMRAKLFSWEKCARETLKWIIK